MSPLVVAVILGFSGLASAQAPTAQLGREPARLVLLRGSTDEVPDALRGQVDQALGQAITTQTRFGSTADSPIPFDDIELAAGCVARDADCMRRISATLGDDWFMIRELSQDSSGRVYLALTAHDGPRAEVTRRAVAEVAPSGDRAAANVVPTLIERLYAAERERAGGTGSLAAPAGAGSAPPPNSTPGAKPVAVSTSVSPADAGGTGRRQEQRAALPRAPSAGRARTAAAVAGWTTTLIGGGLLAGGVTLGALSRADHRSYERTSLTYSADVDRADELLERARSRARTANVLLIAGAATSAAGIVTVLWSYLQPRTETRSMALKVAPVRGGVALSVKGAWRGGI